MKYIMTESQFNTFMENKGLYDVELIGYSESFDTKLNEVFELQKKFLISICSLQEDKVESVIFLENYKKKFIKDIFSSKDEIIREYNSEFTTKVIHESKYDIQTNIDEFFKLVGHFLKREINLTEQATVLSSQLSWFERIQQYGITNIMEQIRGYLFTNIGMGIQILASMSGIGAIGVDIIWAIFALYDAYEYFVNKKPQALTNLIIDVLCIVSGGVLANVLKPFSNFVGKGISEILGKMMNSSAGQSLKPILSKLPALLQKMTSKLQSVGQFISKKLGMNWAASQISNLMGWLTRLRNGASSLVATTIDVGIEKGLTLAGKSAFLRKGVQVIGKLTPELMASISKKPVAELSSLVGVKIESTITKAIEKEVESRFKEAPAEQVLSWIDKTYGSHYGDLYAIFLGATKLSKHQGKLKTGTYDIQDYGAEMLRGRDPGTKAEREAGRVSQGVGGLTSTQSATSTAKKRTA